MKRRAFTDTYIKSLKPRERRYELGDAGSRGLWLRVEPSGAKTFWSVYRRDGKLQRVRLGAYPGMSLAQAREAHQGVRVAIEQGRDPAAEHRQAKASRTSPRLAMGETVGALAEIYVRQNLDGKRSRKEVERRLGRDILPVIGPLAVAEITRPVIHALLDPIREASPSSANATFSIIRRLLNVAVDRGLMVANPAAGMARPAPERSRDRTLTPEEIRALWAIEPPLHAFAFRWLLACGCRKGELLGARWTELEGNAWVIPRERVKTDAVHVVPLSSLMRELLRTAPRVNAYWLPGRGEGPLRATALNKVLNRTQLGDFTVHDIRRTVRTGLSDCGVGRDIAERVIGHVVGSRVERTYDRHAYFSEKAEALEKWANRVRGILAGEAGVIHHLGGS